MIDFSPTYSEIEATDVSPWLDTLIPDVDKAMEGKRWGDLPNWLKAMEGLPSIRPSTINLSSNSICIGNEKDCDEKTKQIIEEKFRALHPWRKGPFDVFGVHIDTEWRSDIKWDRLKSVIAPLKGRKVLDVGCGSGYHCLRMAGEGARLALGIDPTILYVVQFHALQKYIQNPSVSVFPIGIDNMPDDIPYFDTVFSMGLLYHRRAPFDHLIQLQSFLREGGELILETLVIDGRLGEVLSPQGRYARMPNVWFIPSPPTLESWLKRMGFMNVRLVDISQTTSEEQRATDWMGFHSLENFLDPKNPSRTIEGYPSPQRAIYLANKP